MKVTVDLDICQGNGVCVKKAPGVFQLGDDEKVVLLIAEPASDQHDNVRMASQVCPTQAILVEED